MITVFIIAVLLTIIAVLWVRLKFWRWSARTRLEIIDTQRKTIETYAEQRRKELAYNKAYSQIEWPEEIEEK